jgi:hypothetical protein
MEEIFPERHSPIRAIDEKSFLAPGHRLQLPFFFLRPRGEFSTVVLSVFTRMLFRSGRSLTALRAATSVKAEYRSKGWMAARIEGYDAGV